nr:ribonuclease H-like domain-containing protein [Tanacetum cinerariifolium]
MLEVIDTFCVSNKDNTRKQGNNEDTSSKTMLAINGVGFDWSDMAEEHVQTNMTLMMFLDSEGNLQKDDKGFINSGCSRHMTENIAYLSNFKNFDGGYVTSEGGAHGSRISGKGILKADKLDFENVHFVNELKFNIFSVSQIEKGIKKEYSIVRTPQQNRVADRRNKTLIEATRTMLADFKLPTTFWAEAVSTACYVQNRVLIVKPHNKTPYELFRGFKPALSFMRPFGCHVTIFNTFDNLGKFDGKSDERFFVGYFLSSKAFRVYNTKTRKVEENLQIAPGTISYESTGIQGDLNIGTSLGKEATSQDYIVMPIWKDASYFDTPSMDVEDGTHNEDDDKYKSEDDYSPKEVNDVGKHVNTSSLDVNISRFKLNTVDISLNS